MIDKRTMAEAAAWLARLQSDQPTARDREACEAWLASSSVHRRALAEVTAAWEAAGGLAADMVEAEPPSRGSADRAGRLLVERRGALAAGLAGLCGAVLWARSATRSYATGLGETRDIRFHDGSRVLLDACSLVHIPYRRDVQRLDLVRGRLGLFPAVNPDRPFVVVGSGRRVLPMGSVDVSCLDGFSVTAVDGPALVQAPGQAAVRLDPGERVRAASPSRLAKDRPPLAVETAWRAGQLIFSDDTLGAAVAEVNRYNRKPLVLGEPDLGALRVSGSYNARQGDDFARSVATLFGLSVVEQPDRLVLERERVS